MKKEPWDGRAEASSCDRAVFPAVTRHLCALELEGPRWGLQSPQEVDSFLKVSPPQTLTPLALPNLVIALAPRMPLSV